MHNGITQKNRPVADTKNKVLDFSNLSSDAKAQLVLHFGSGGDHWSEHQIATCCPPGTLLAGIFREFFEGSSIPMEIPIAMTLTILSGELAMRGTELRIAGIDTIAPQLWWSILAPAGCGKSWTLTKLRSIFGTDAEVDATGCVSSAALFRVVSEKPRGWWICDEWGHFLRQLERISSPLAESKAMLMRVYNGDSVTRERANTENALKIDSPALAIAGVSVDETFREAMTTESILDGFGSRFAYAYGQRDRPWWEHPTWIVEVDDLREQWQLLASKILPYYETPTDVLDVFEEGFRRLHGALVRKEQEVPEAFFRRVLHRHHKLALICHVLTSPEDKQLSRADYDLSERIVAWQLRDGRRLIEDISGGNLGELVNRAINWAQRRVAKNQSVTRRDLLSGVRGIANAPMADFVHRCISENLQAEHKPEQQNTNGHTANHP